ncbi:S41 family peptidase [Undibacterium fentianense]|uniref:S41 family peptidase n=1 Tax=Undibacterium fentianense TaxID=2828728 RepID=A0A941E3B6_9BURK|nr:S41 family peptidase [Undibacterium fentianense]MBR7801530.1 S41 family peptidase [Undibacterium fentianense]
MNQTLKKSIAKALICLSGFLSASVVAFELKYTVIGTDTLSIEKPNTLNEQARKEIIDEIANAMFGNYVFEDVAKKIGDDLKARLLRGEYDKLDQAQDFAIRLTKDLREVSHDQHIEVFLTESVFPKDSTVETREQRRAKALERSRLGNFGIQKYEVLEGNIGLLEFNEITYREFGENAITAVMSLAANADALIIDLRKSRGGDPHMIEWITSYLLGDHKVHLNDLYFRRINLTQEYWTDPAVPGPRFDLNKPIYILTSALTFSAAEEITYDLQSLKRATVVGEATRGGAHMVNPFELSNQLSIYIPIARAINPITKTNWEGNGVKPDVVTTEEGALKAARLLALESVAKQTKDLVRKEELQTKIDKLKAGIL